MPMAHFWKHYLLCSRIQVFVDKQDAARFRSTTAVEDVVTQKGELLWRREYYEALDLVTSEIKRRFDQAGMTTAAQREQILMDSAKGTVCTEAELSSLQLPSNMDRASLHLQLRMLGDLTKKETLRTVQGLGLYMSKLQPQTRGLFRWRSSSGCVFVYLCLQLPPRDPSPRFAV
ncbi:hypothetical protein DPX16_8903 [Anabarilius grahami]|uniref:Uncharacterized protein n=1 Tax=Anabarilius grahami TaxID=495550 RepID=A0A3N0XTJ2_ANAGA|nr:hypothetical protein DPX16_8903 [Anabarilius grahami]